MLSLSQVLGVLLVILYVHIDILAYADDLILIAPSSKALQSLFCMIFSPLNKRCFVTFDFPDFTLGDKCVTYVSKFKYLWHYYKLIA